MHSLRARILVSFTLTLAVIVAALGAWHYRNMSGFIKTAFATETGTYTSFLARQAVAAVYTENRDELETLARHMVAVPSIDGVRFLNPSGQVIFTQFAGFGPGQSAATNAALISGSDCVIGSGAVVLSSVGSLLDNASSSRVIGYVNLYFSTKAVDAKLSAIAGNVVMVELILALGSLLLIVFIERWVTGPLIGLIEKVQRMAGGDLASRVAVPQSRDEIATLCASVNQMADAIETHTRHLEALVDEKTRAIEQRERQMMYLEKMASLGRISASIAHEINNPLNFISLGLDFLESQKPHTQEALTGAYRLRDDEVWQVVKDIRRGSSRVKAIVDSLRGFARQDEEELRQYEPVGVVDDVLQMFRHDLETVGVDVEVQIDVSSTVGGSPLRLHQILVNLVGNALDAHRDAGTKRPRLRVRGWESPGEVHLAVDDNGPGISAANRGRIFEPFFTTKPPGKGTGLGLALSFEMAAREGGRITLAEPALKGVTFELVVPRQRTS